jgi:uncharacterized protein
MTPQEQEMIGDLIDRVQKTQLAEKDMDAEQMLQDGLGRNPDALYILAQTVLVQKYALEQSQAQLAQAKAQIEQMQQRPEPKHATSFLGNLLGRNDAPAPPPPPPPPAQGWAQVPPQYVAGGYPPQYAPVGYGAPMGMGSGGGFLRGAMQTAAGVAAGALAFEGIESLMHGFGHAAGYGPGLGGFGGGDRPEIINNYYGDEHGGERGVSGDEHAIGSQFDRDTAGGLDSKSGGDSAYSASGDGGSELDDRASNDLGSDAGGARFDDAGSLDDGGGSDFDNGSGLNDDGSGFDDGGAVFDDGGGGGFDDGGGDNGSF